MFVVKRILVNIPPLLLISIFLGVRISTRAGWCESLFQTVLLFSHGVWQGAVRSHILFGVYINDLLDGVSNLGVSCFWDSLFAGAECYLDDMVLFPHPSQPWKIMLVLL